MSTLLTFLQTGGNPEDIEHEEDRERLLAAIESSFGDVSYFNKLLRREKRRPGEEDEELSARDLAGCWLNCCSGWCRTPYDADTCGLVWCSASVVWAKDDDTIAFFSYPVNFVPAPIPLGGKYRRGVRVEAGTGRRIKSSRYKKVHDCPKCMPELYFDVKDRSTMRSNLSLCNHFRIC